MSIPPYPEIPRNLQLGREITKNSCVRLGANKSTRDILSLGNGEIGPPPPSEPAVANHLRRHRLKTPTLRLLRLRIDLHGGRYSAHEPNAVRHFIDVDAHRDALGEPHPGEDRVHRRQSCLIRLRVRNIDAARDTIDVAANELAVTHQLDRRAIAFMHPAKSGLLEVAVDPK